MKVSIDTLKQQLNDYKKELVKYQNYFAEDGTIDASEQEHLNSMKSIIERSEAKIVELEKKKAKIKHDEVQSDPGGGPNLTVGTNKDGSVYGGLSYKSDEGKEGGFTVDSEGTVNVKIGKETKGDDGKSKVGLEMNTKGEFKGTAQHEFKNGIKGSAEITNDKLKLELGKKWSMETPSIYWPIIPSTNPTGIGLFISGRLKGTAGIAASEEVNWSEGMSKIGINVNGSVTGSVRIGAEVVGFLAVSGECSITTSLAGNGYLVYKGGDDLSPEASVTGGLDFNLDLILWLSEPIIQSDINVGVKRSQL
ncbi:MAG: hypothetical protein MK207_13025 [Saprospiraceae bacterium]|nr:hypothetical protein [Saprospiraceae bacterium]